MKNILVTTLLFGFQAALFGQDLSGHWTGRLYQNDIGWYDFELQLTAGRDSSYTGTSYINSGRGSGTLDLTATFDGAVFHFQESKVKDQRWNVIGWYWCIKTGDLRLTKQADSLVLSGAWEASGTCKPGTLRVAKAQKAPPPVTARPNLPPPRQVETKELMQVAEGEVLVEIWDHENEDGDIASISLNGEVVLKNHLVTVRKHQFRIALQTGKNMLVLYAENLGARPPNTAALTIYYDGQTKTVILNSDTNKSEAIQIWH